MSFTLTLCFLHTWLGGNLPDSAPPLPFHTSILCPVCPGLPLPQFCLLAWSLPLGPPFLLLCTLSYTEVCAQAGAPWGGHLAPSSGLSQTHVFTCAYMCCFLLEKQIVVYIILYTLNLYLLNFYLRASLWNMLIT